MPRRRPRAKPPRRITRRHVMTHAAVALATAAAMTAAAPHAPPSSPSGVQGAAAAAPWCDPALWQHVYHPDRFTILDACHRMTGIVQSVRYEADGDAHVQVRPDPAFSNMLNAANHQSQNDALVVEIVCAKTPTQLDAVMACMNYQNEVWIPPIGAHVEAVGPWVTDNQHGWNEQHPITSIANATG